MKRVLSPSKDDVNYEKYNSISQSAFYGVNEVVFEDEEVCVIAYESIIYLVSEAW